MSFSGMKALKQHHYILKIKVMRELQEYTRALATHYGDVNWDSSGQLTKSLFGRKIAISLLKIVG